MGSLKPVVETAFVFLETSHLVRFINSLPRFGDDCPPAKKVWFPNPNIFHPAQPAGRSDNGFLGRDGKREPRENVVST